MTPLWGALPMSAGSCGAPLSTLLGEKQILSVSSLTRQRIGGSCVQLH